MTPQEIMNGIKEKNRLLSAKNDEYINLAEDRAQKEREFTKALAKEILKLRANNTPVTMLKDVARGGHVADLKFQWDVAAAVEKACLNQIKILTGQLDSYRSLLSWQKAELQSQ